TPKIPNTTKTTPKLIFSSQILNSLTLGLGWVVKDDIIYLLRC
ncbi:unnamed protein product, partial [marine sediment metagenome]